MIFFDLGVSSVLLFAAVALASAQELPAQFSAAGACANFARPIGLATDAVHVFPKALEGYKTQQPGNGRRLVSGVNCKI